MAQGIIGLCGGKITETYWTLQEIDLDELLELIDEFKAYQDKVYKKGSK